MQTTINTDVFIRNVLNTLMTQMESCNARRKLKRRYICI